MQRDDEQESGEVDICSRNTNDCWSADFAAFFENTTSFESATDRFVPQRDCCHTSAGHSLRQEDSL